MSSELIAWIAAAIVLAAVLIISFSPARSADAADAVICYREARYGTETSAQRYCGMFKSLARHSRPSQSGNTTRANP